MPPREIAPLSLTETENIFDSPLLEIASSSLNVVAKIGSGERPSSVATFCVGSISVDLFTPAPKLACCNFHLQRYIPNVLCFGRTTRFLPCHGH